MLRRKRFWVLIILFVLTLGASFFAYRWGRDFTANQVSAIFDPLQPVAVATQTGPITDTTVIRIALPKAWDGKQRINVLLLGIDQRVGDGERGHRTDTMMVLTLDPVTLSAGILSIPRDLWVPIPGYGSDRINTANYKGDTDDYPGGGPALAKKTVENLLGIPIDYYARMNFTAFEDFVDRIGGITIDVPEDIVDKKYPTSSYGTEVFTMTKGVRTMDGATALKYARTRATFGGDFDRARRQQQVIFAVRDKLTQDPRALPTLFAGSDELWASLKQSVKTDMPIDLIQRLAVLAKDIDRKNIRTAVIDQNYTENVTTPDGMQVEVPVQSEIRKLRNTLFTVGANSAAEIQKAGGTPAPVSGDWKSESARLIVLNGTPQVGFASRVRQALEARGFTVVEVGNAPDDRFDYAATTFTDYSGKPATVAAVADALGLRPAPEAKRSTNGTGQADIVVVLGADARLP
ncbi:MAG: LCP family protein [Thermoflexales bacterium]|nr:LCP family protein [Thermoflexales bacterium]